MTSVLLDAKLALPTSRPGTLPRTALVDRVRSDERRIVAVTAPAGYGKSTFLRQWAEREQEAVAWVSFEPTDDDQAVVLELIAAALDRVEALDGSLRRGVPEASGSLGLSALGGLADAMWRMHRPVVLMLDDVHHLRTSHSRDALAWVSEHLPPHVRLVVASREWPPLPLARLRARGQVLELGVRDLAMSVREARGVFRQAGLSDDDERVEEVTIRAEGWPAGIYLAALSLRAGGTGWTGAPEEGDADRNVAGFLHAELLDRLSPELIGFLCGTAPLARFDADLCDHVLQRRDSAERLGELERTNLFLLPLDGRSRSCRYHHLFRELLLGELRRRQPEQEALILARAAGWCSDHGDIDAAMEYGHRAGSDDLVAALLARHGMSVFRSGRLTTLDRWLGWFDATTSARTPDLTLLGAWISALSGQTGRAERWADAMLPMLPELNTRTRASYAALRVNMGILRPADALAEARLAMDTMPEVDDWRAGAFAGSAVVSLVCGDVATAEVLLIRAIDIGIDQGGIPAVTAALGVRASIAAGRGDWELAAELVRRARALVGEHGLESYITSTLFLAMGARVAIHRGLVAQAQADIAAVQRLRPALTAALPYVAALARLDLARAYLASGEVAGCRLMLAEVEELLAVRPGIAPLAGAVARLRERTGGMTRGRAGAATLTTAELRLLGYLPSHLSFREIADRLFVSINTVKTQAISIYGKLGVSSRSAAIEAAVASGLLDPSATRFPTSPPGLDLG